MKKCPFCGEEVQDAAVKCKHCKEWLSKPEENTQQPVNINDSRAELPFLLVVKKSIKVVLIILAIVAIFSPLRTIILQAAMVITGLWALISGKIWFVDDKYTVKSSTARGIGALLVSAVPLSLISGLIVINEYGDTNNAISNGSLIEAGIFFTIAVIAYIIYRMSRQIK